MESLTTPNPQETATQEARELIEKSIKLQNNPSYSSFEGIDLMDNGSDQTKEVEEMVSSGKISAEEVEEIKNEILAKNQQQEVMLKNDEAEGAITVKNLIEDYDLHIGKKMIMKDISGRTREHEVLNIDKESGTVEIGTLNERGVAVITNFYNSKNASRLGSDLSSIEKKESSEPKEINMEQKIKNVSSLGELYRVLRDAGGIKGSSEYYSAEQIWERVQAYVENKADENIITRTDGLREKVKMLKLERELKKQGNDQKEVHGPVKPVEENNKEEISPEHKEEIPSPENQENDTSDFEIASMGRLLSEFSPQQQKQYEASIKKYGQAYVEKGSEAFENKAHEIKKSYIEAMEKIGLPSSQWGTTEKWIVWDLAKQTYLAEHPEESNEHYKLGDPFENQEVVKDIIDRHVGWEVLGYAKSNPNFITMLDATKNSFSEIHTLLNEGEKNGKLPSYKLTELGNLVEQNKVS